MNIAEMHVWFRQYAQQMGMQNVRAILPEQIDNLINTSTKDTIDEIVRLNVGTTNDRIITDNAKIANINALRTLYKVKTINAYNIADYQQESIKALSNKPVIIKSSVLDEVPLYFVDFAIRYCDREPSNDNKDKLNYTRWFPIRVIDDAYLADILNDWILAPRMRTPIMVVYAIEGDNEHSTFELYVGENEETGISTVSDKKWIGQIRCSFIKTPNKVQYLSDVGGPNVHSDLPEQLQIPMLKHAVDLYRASIQGSLFAQQENNQANQREIARNNTRPDNDGYQS